MSVARRTAAMTDVPDTFDAYAADRTDVRFTDWLRGRADPDWTAAVDGRPDAFYLDEWIELHANPGFIDFVAWLREELDREGAAVSPRRQ